MNVLIDGPTEPQHYFDAITAFMKVRAENPNQGLGNGEGILHEIDGTMYEVVRNAESYAIRVGVTGEEELEPLGGFPV